MHSSFAWILGIADNSTPVIQNVDAPQVSVDTSPDLLECVTPEMDLIDKWCVVEYDKVLYPGIITDSDIDSVEVKTMSRIGVNRFFWPKKEDIIWYDYQKIYSLIPEPKNVTSRHVEVEKKFWDAICLKTDN